MKQFAKALDRVGAFARRCRVRPRLDPRRSTRIRRPHRSYGLESLEERTLLSIGGSSGEPLPNIAAADVQMPDVQMLSAAAPAEPLAVEIKLTAGDGAADDQFGRSIATDGDLMVVGAWGDDDMGDHAGAAYIYHFNGLQWVEEAKLTAADGAAGDSFGVSVAISGDTVVVGAWGDDDAGTASGSAYVFSRNLGGEANWGLWDKIGLTSGGNGNLFAHSVSISGDTLAVGAYAEDTAGLDAGCVHIYAAGDMDAGDGWGSRKIIVADDAADLDAFGFSVALDADTLVVGAHKDDDAGANSGSAYVFERHQGGEDNWGQVKKLTADDAAAYDLFGATVAVGGDVIAVGASQDDDAGNLSGSAYVFGRNAGGDGNWGQAKKLTADDAAAGDRFGNAVEISGDRVVVGAYKSDDAGYDAGSAYLFESDRGGAGQWGELLQLTAGDAAWQDSFGNSVAIDGDRIAVAAYGDDDLGSQSGSAYVYQLALDDFGDAPASYATLAEDDGARHKLGADLYLGDTVDADFDGRPSQNADGDDADRSDDEDGVVLDGTLVPDGVSSVEVTASADGFLDGWIDFDSNGDWTDPAEHVFESHPLSAGVNVLWIEVPTAAVGTEATYARFRFSSVGGLSPSGVAPDGEVEDYVVAVNSPPTASDDEYLGYVDTTLMIDAADGLLANDTDQGGGSLTASPVSDPLHGTLVLLADGSFVYTPDAGYTGPDSFTYIAGDGELESDEATVTIEVQPPPALTIRGVAVVEGDSATVDAVFDVSLSHAIDAPVTVNYATSSDTATAGADYLPASGTLTFAPNETERSIVVKVLGDETYENHETFVVSLSNPVRAVLGSAVAEGTVLNDDTLVEPVELEFSTASGYFTVATGGVLPVRASLVNSAEDFFGFQLAFNNSHITYGRLELANWARDPVWDAESDGVLDSPTDNFVAAGALQAVSAPADLGTFDVIAPPTPGQYVLSASYSAGGAFSTGLVGLSGLVPINDYGDVIITVVDDPILPLGYLSYPVIDQQINQDLGYVDVRWVDPGPPASGINPNLIGIDDVTIDNDGTPLSVDRVELQFGGVYRYYYGDDGETLANGPVSVTFVEGQIVDIAGNGILEQTQGFEFDLDAPTVVSVEANVGPVDPPDLAEDNPQPSNWQTQRSDMRTIVVNFDRDVVLGAADLRLVNLGIDAPADADTVVPLSDAQISLAGGTLTIDFAPFELDSGVYELEVLPTVTDLAGNPLDGNGDGTPGDSYVFTGDGTNLFYKLNGDWNGDMAVSILDLPTLGYWFGYATDAAPEYVDLNADGAISMFDWPRFVSNFGRAMVFPAAAPAAMPLDTGLVVPSAAAEAVVMDLIPHSGTVSFDPDGTKVVTVEPGATINFTQQVLDAQDDLAGFQLSYDNSDDGPGELQLYGWTTAPDWPLVMNGDFDSAEGDTFVAAANAFVAPPVQVPPAVTLGSFVAVAPTVPGDFLISLGTGGVGPFDTWFLSSSGASLAVGDYGDVIVRVVDENPSQASVAGRYVFYDGSAFDKPAAGLSDDDAIALDKVALLPGETATFANYTSYRRGINGVMIDLAGPANTAALGPDDFQFRMGNDDAPDAWAAAPAPEISVRAGEGLGGSDRVTLTWGEDAVKTQWLQVTVLATANTALAEHDVFYFGNAVGDTGNSPSEATVTSIDEILARNNPQVFDPADVLNLYDFNRDRLVTSTDQIIARNNVQVFESLELITVPAAAESGSAEPSSSELEWLDELGRIGAQSRPSQGENAVERAVDALLTSFWS